MVGGCGMAEDRLGPLVRYVKIFNIVAGILLVGGTIVLVGALLLRSMGGSDDRAGETVTLGVAPGDLLFDSSISEDRLLLAFETPEGGRYLLIVDAETGQTLKRIDLAEER